MVTCKFLSAQLRFFAYYRQILLQIIWLKKKVGLVNNLYVCYVLIHSADVDTVNRVNSVMIMYTILQ